LIPAELEKGLCEKGILGRRILSSKTLSGGCIHRATKIETPAGEFCLKYNTSAAAVQFAREAKGLELLSENSDLIIPEVFFTGVISDFAVILMSYIEPGRRRKDYWQSLGEKLGGLHAHHDEKFGLNEDNFIGSLTQINRRTEIWEVLFRDRIEKLLLDAEKKGISVIQTGKQFEKLYPKLPSLLPKEKPSLLHGDLWPGNLLIAGNGEPALIDPAVHFGHREAEIAFTTLFGRFDEEFYESYFSVSPSPPGWEERIPVYNLYPLMVHLVLFGESYLPEIEFTLRKYA
jgi:fructosamine-3-kinase